MAAGKEARDAGCLPARAHRPRARLDLRALLVLLLAGIPVPAWGGDVGTPQLQRWYQELSDISQRSPFGLPLRMHSEERNDQVSAEVHAILEHPFDTVKAALSSPATWCEIDPLNVTEKACTHQAQGQEALLTLYIGRKFYQRPLATAVSLATLGRDKVGFSREEAGPGRPPGYVKGLRGIVERNIMRYYLAIEAYLDTQTVPAPHRFEARINMAYELMERYPLQLHDLEKAEYLDAKRREREDQLRLQQSLSGGTAQRNGP